MLAVTAFDNDQMDERETEIFQQTAPVWIDGKRLDWSVLLSLELHGEDVTLVDHLVDFHGQASVGFDQQCLASTSATMIGGVAKVLKLGKFG